VKEHWSLRHQLVQSHADAPDLHDDIPLIADAQQERIFEYSVAPQAWQKLRHMDAAAKLNDALRVTLRYAH